MLHKFILPLLQNDVDAYSQIRRCVLKFCQIDKNFNSHLRICMLQFCNLGKISTPAANRLDDMKHLRGRINP